MLPSNSGILAEAIRKNKTIYDTIYEQIDGVSMGSWLGPLLANIIMTDLETVIVDK